MFLRPETSLLGLQDSVKVKFLTNCLQLPKLSCAASHTNCHIWPVTSGPNQRRLCFAVIGSQCTHDLCRVIQCKVILENLVKRLGRHQTKACVIFENTMTIRSFAISDLILHPRFTTSRVVHVNLKCDFGLDSTSVL